MPFISIIKSLIIVENFDISALTTISNEKAGL